MDKNNKRTKKITMKLNILIGTVCVVLLYSIVGTGQNIDKIKILAPQNMAKRNWQILRYEGYNWGSWDKNGGYCWYHVCNIDNHSIQYRVKVSLWRGELQYYYGEPEKLNRVDVNLEN